MHVYDHRRSNWRFSSGRWTARWSAIPTPPSRSTSSSTRSLVVFAVSADGPAPRRPAWFTRYAFIINHPHACSSWICMRCTCSCLQVKLCTDTTCLNAHINAGVGKRSAQPLHTCNAHMHTCNAHMHTCNAHFWLDMVSSITCVRRLRRNHSFEGADELEALQGGVPQWLERTIRGEVKKKKWRRIRIVFLDCCMLSRMIPVYYTSGMVYYICVKKHGLCWTPVS